MTVSSRKTVTIIITLLLAVSIAFGAIIYLYTGEKETLGDNFGGIDTGQMTQAMTAVLEDLRAQTNSVVNSGMKTVDDAKRAKAISDAETLAARHVIAHRGSSGSQYEHSFKAYDEAIEVGVLYIEQDIVVSRNGTLYVSHDTNAKRMTGVNREFSDMEDSEIDGLVTHAGEKVLRLSEVFDRYGTSIDYVIELKDEGSGMVQPFIDIVRQYGFENRVSAQCFELSTLEELEKIFPEMPKMYLCKDAALLDQGYNADFVDVIAPQDSMMTEENVKRAHDMGKQFSSWPINSEEWIKKAIDLQVDSYFTDQVEKALTIEKEYGVMKRSGQGGQ